jgi:heat-inducible transcriptional repressor
MNAPELSPRSGRILATVVRHYIHTGEPVASVVVARRGALGVSSATIRSVLSRLEEQGFVRQPHTSAGRVPTDRGYRFYVDLLLEHRRPFGRSGVAAQIRQVASEGSTVEELLASASRVLSQESRHVGFAMSAVTEDQRLRKLEFVALGGTRVLVVTIAEDGQITQKIVDGGEPLTSDDLRRAAEYVNREFSGLPIDAVRTAILARLHEARGLYDHLMAQAFAMAERALSARNEHQALFVDGTASLIAEAQQQHGEMSLSTLRALVEMIEEKQRLVRLLTEYLEAPGLAVIIGAEHTLPDLKPFSLVAASYLDGGRGGSVGVIGPTRMQYSRAISVVESAARALGNAFGDGHN